MTAFSMNHFGQDFHSFSLAAIFSKFSDGIKENHKTRKINFHKFVHLLANIGPPVKRHLNE